jgi:hypothetical protein
LVTAGQKAQQHLGIGGQEAGIAGVDGQFRGRGILGLDDPVQRVAVRISRP